MRRALVATLALLTACGSDAKGTFVRLHFEQRGAQPDATRIQIHATLTGHAPADEEFVIPSGRSLSAGLTGTLQIETGEGPITVTATAFAGPTSLQALDGAGTVIRGQTSDIYFCFGPGCGDGGVPEPDAAADAQTPDAQTPDAGADDASVDAGSPAVLAIAPGSKDFGSIVTNSAGADVTFTISNTGSSTTNTLLVRRIGTDRADFVLSDENCNGTTLTTAGTCTVTLAFSPRSAGAKTATLEISAAGASTASASLMGTGLAPANLAINPASQGFPDTQTGTASTDATFTVRNTGLAATGALTTTISPPTSDFVISQAGCGAPLDPTTSCTITVHFQPQQAGDRSASLVVTDASGSAAATLSGKGLAPPSLALLPITQDFGSATIGNQTGSTDFTLRNTGGVASSAPAVSLSDAMNYEVLANGCTTPLAPNATCIISVRFTPTASPGAKPAMLLVSATQGGNASSQLKGDALAPSTLSMTPSAPQAYGSAAVGTTSAETPFTITNTGGSPTGVTSVSLSGNDPGSFTISSNTCTAVLAPQASCTVGISFAPTAVGGLAATMSVTSAPGGVVAASLSGTGTAQLTVVKTGTGGGTVTSTSSAGINCGATCVATFATPTVTLAAAPDPSSDLTSWSGGGCSGTGACVVSLDMATSVTATFTIKPALLGLAPASQDFGNVTVGASASTTFTVTNSGGSASGAVSNLVTDALDYTIAGGTCGGALAAGASCTIVVRFNPVGAAGPKPAALNVSANPGGMPSAALTGSALTAGQLTLLPAAKDFGTISLGSLSAETLFTVTNSGGSATGPLGAPSVSDAANFAVSSNTCAGALAAGATCFVGVRFAPSSVGLKQGVSLTISAAPGGSAAATLQGTGSAQLLVGDEGGGTVTSVPAGINCLSPCAATFTSSPVMLTATPDATHIFVTWNGACSGNGACSVTLDAASKTVGAIFQPAIQANLAVSGSDAPDPVPNSQNITYSYTIGNYGPNTGTNVSFQDPLPAGVIFVSATSPGRSCVFSGGVVTCSLGSMAANTSTTATVTVTAKMPGTINNIATVSAAEFEPVPVDNTSVIQTTIQNAADLGITSFTDAPDPANLTSTILYTAVVRNFGPDSAIAVSLTDNLPPSSLSFVSASASVGNCSHSGGAVTCQLGSIASGNSVTVLIRANPTALVTVTNTVNVTANSVDLVNANNSASTTTLVL